MIKHEIIEFIKKYPRTYSQQLTKKQNKELLDKILKNTKFLDLHNDLNLDIWLSTRCWFILNNITEIQQLHKCDNCGKFLVKNHFLSDKINDNRLQFCNILCKNLYYNNKKQKKYQQYINSLSELNIKYWELQGFSYHDAAMKVREYKPNYKEYWISRGYSEEEAKQKVNNVENPIKLEYWIAKGYSEEEAIKQIDNEKNNRLKKIPKYKEYWIAKGYSEEEAIKQAKYEYCIKNPTTIEYWVSKGYSEEEARYEIRKRKKISKEYWIAKGYSEEEAIKQAKYEANIRNQTHKEFWIAKGYSEEEAIKQAKCHGNHFEAAHILFTKKQNHFCKEYWIAKGYSEEEAIKQAKLTNKNTTKNIPYEVRIDAYRRGRKNITDEDKKRIALKISKKLKNKNKMHSPIFKEYWISRGYSEEEAKKQASITKFSSDGKLIRASKIETCFFNELESYLKTIKFIRQKWVRINEKNYCQDGRYNNIVIEFNGTNFHMDERFYSSNDCNPLGVKFDDVKQRDKNKIDAYLLKQYNIIVVWEYDFINHKDELFSKIKEIIKNEKSYKAGSYWDSASVFNKC